MTTTESAAALSSGLHARYSKLVFPRVNLIDKIWKTRPSKPQGEVFLLDLKFTGTCFLPPVLVNSFLREARSDELRLDVT